MDSIWASEFHFEGYNTRTGKKMEDEMPIVQSEYREDGNTVTSLRGGVRASIHESGAKAIDRQGEIPQQVELFENSIAMLAEKVERLITKMSPLLAPAPPDQPADKVPEGCSSPFAEKLRQMRNLVEAISVRLEYTTRDLEL